MTSLKKEGQMIPPSARDPVAAANKERRSLDAGIAEGAV